MKREYTNAVRWVLDELVPPVLRDSKWFMYPFFWAAYHGKNVDFYMHFKDHVVDLSDEEFARAYEEMDSVGTSRPTDMNEASMIYARELFHANATTLLDAGCGRGYWLDRLARETELTCTGVDIVDSVDLAGGATYVQAPLERLPFGDDEFDIAFSSHTLEHVVDLDRSIEELVRVAREQVIIVVPRQRYYRYTLDMHLNFFPTESSLRLAMRHPLSDLRSCGGDWVCQIDLTQNS